MPPTISLPSQEYTFEIDVIGEKTDQRFAGTFTYKRPTLGKGRQARCMKARLMEDQPHLDRETILLCEMLGWLHYGLISVPPWWNDPQDLYDLNVITVVFTNVLDFEMNFKDKIKDVGKKNPSKKKKNKKADDDVEEDNFEQKE